MPKRAPIYCSLLVAVAALVALPIPSHGYAQQHGCFDFDPSWIRSNGPDGDVPWSSVSQAKKDALLEGFEDADVALDYNGTSLIDVREESGVESFPVYWRDVPGGKGLSNGCAGGPTSFLWVSVNSSTTQLHNIGRHEILHKAGAHHAGEEDSFNNDNPPTMATCLNEVSPTSTLDQDGQANLNWLYSGLSDRQLHANIGFEQGFAGSLPKFWGRNDASVEITEFTTGGAQGASYIGWHANDNASQYLYQTVRVLNGDDDYEYRAKLNARSPSNQHSTWARVRLYRRGVDLLENYEHADCSSSNWVDGIEYANGNVGFTGWIQMTESPLTFIESASAWEPVATSAWVNPPTWEAYDFQVRAYGTAYNAGNYGKVNFDNVRGEGR